MKSMTSIQRFKMLLAGVLLFLISGTLFACVPAHTSLLFDYRYPPRPYPYYYDHYYYGPYYYYPDYYGYYSPFYYPRYRSYPYVVPAPPSSGRGRTIR
ncbi:MAG: hypothetical protein HYR80_00605 [Nitrospirae bacterium]|nr:hypothetical protein [Nitrospirota bacterium]